MNQGKVEEANRVRQVIASSGIAVELKMEALQELASPGGAMAGALGEGALLLDAAAGGATESPLGVCLSPCL